MFTHVARNLPPSLNVPKQTAASCNNEFPFISLVICPSHCVDHLGTSDIGVSAFSADQ